MLPALDGVPLERTLAYLLRHEAAHNLLLEWFPKGLGGPLPEGCLIVSGADEVEGLAMRAPGGDLVMLGCMAPEVATRAAELWHRHLSPFAAVKGAPAELDAFAAQTARLREARAVPGLRMRLLQLTSLLAPSWTEGRAELAAEWHFDLAVRWFEAFRLDLGGNHARTPIEHLRRWLENGRVVLWLGPDDEPRSMAVWSRESEHGATVSYVYTPPDWRGQGCASHAVAAVCRQALDRGKAFCVLYADADNPTSNRLYERLGFHPVGELNEVAFSSRTSEEP
jgi:RimJ/RimL family protein N-acetyltransferase